MVYCICFSQFSELCCCSSSKEQTKKIETVKYVKWSSSVTIIFGGLYTITGFAYGFLVRDWESFLEPGSVNYVLLIRDIGIFFSMIVLSVNSLYCYKVLSKIMKKNTIVQQSAIQSTLHQNLSNTMRQDSGLTSKTVPKSYNNNE